MPFPLKAGYHFDYSHYRRPPRYEMTAAEAYTDLFILKFTDTMISDLLKLMNANSFDELLNGQKLTIHLKESEQEKVLQIMKEMEQEWNSYNQYSEIILKGLLNKLLIFCFSRQKNAEKGAALHKEKKPDKLLEAIGYIKSHLDESPSLQETAGYIHVSSSYLSKIFTSRLHTPYSTFVLNEKILYAQKLLVDSEMSMAEIAGMAGFSSNSYFSDCFKRTIGMSPLQFRKAYEADGYNVNISG